MTTNSSRDTVPLRRNFCMANAEVSGGGCELGAPAEAGGRLLPARQGQQGLPLQVRAQARHPSQQNSWKF